MYRTRGTLSDSRHGVPRLRGRSRVMLILTLMSALTTGALVVLLELRTRRWAKVEKVRTKLDSYGAYREASPRLRRT